MDETDGTGADRWADSQAVQVTVCASEDDPDEAARENHPLLPAGATVGRYVVLATIGRGGMGVVYAAYDPELDRKIALKLLRPGAGREGQTQDPQARLLREAQALARLSHPNVVAVHDVGTFGSDVFVAMEFVDGPPLGRWLAAGRSWRETLDVFLEAGRGLAAAHAAHLIHRDFKPENVLVGHDGRVRVLDFGLARAADEARAAAPVSAAAKVEETDATTTGGSTLQTDLTRTGAIMGTPAYMAPEQHEGGTVDARTDVFGFCVALYEGLYGQRPFAGDNLTVLVAHVLEGRVRDAPPGSDVPGWVRRAVLEGLRVDPAERPATMEALLHKLAHDPTRRTRRLLSIGVGVAALGTVGVLVGLALAGEPRVCQLPEARLAGIWDAERAEQMKLAFDGVDRPYAALALERSRAELDAWVASWRAGWIDACEATRVRAEQSEMALDLRMECLRDQLLDLHATTDLLVDADAEVVTNAVDLVHRLPAVDSCADVGRLTARMAPPDASTAQAVERVREEVAHVWALEGAGKWKQTLDPAREAVDDAVATGYAPIEAEARLALASVLDDNDDAEAASTQLEQALIAAVRGGDDRAAAVATTELIYVLGYRLAQKAPALVRARESAAWIERAGGDAKLQANRMDRLAIVHREFGDLAEARAAIESALALRREAGASEGPLAEALGHLADIEAGEGKTAEAIERLHEVLDMKERIYGPDHPNVAATLNNLGVFEQRLGKLADARARFERVRSIHAAAVGPESSGVALALTNLGSVASQEGKLDEAIEHLRQAERLYERVRGRKSADVAAAVNSLAIALATDRQFEAATTAFREALEIKRALYGDDSTAVAFAENNVGNVLVDQGRYAEGLPHLRRALEMKRRLLGPKHVLVASTLETLGSAHEGQGNCGEALELYREAVAIYEASVGPDNVRVTSALGGVGRCLVEAKEFEPGLASLERALDIRSRSEGDPVELADARFDLATGLAADRRDPSRARALAEQAAAAYAAAGARARSKQERAERWLARH